MLPSLGKPKQFICGLNFNCLSKGLGNPYAKVFIPVCFQVRLVTNLCVSQLPAGEDWRLLRLLRTSPLLRFPSQRRPLSKILSPAFTVQADETFKPIVQWSEMFRSYIEQNQGGLTHMWLIQVKYKFVHFII